MIGKNLGRPKKTIPESYENVILEKYERYRLNALYLEKVIYAEDRVRISHNTIHKVLKKYGFARGETSKQKRDEKRRQTTTRTRKTDRIKLKTSSQMDESRVIKKNVRELNLLQIY